MSNLAAGRVDPRALLRSVRAENAGRVRKVALDGLGRMALLAVCAAVGLGAFGVIVVRASDDQGALAFVRGQVRQRPAPEPAYVAPPRAAYPVSYYVPRAFLPTTQPTVQQPRRGLPQSLPVAQPPQRTAPIVASYAPFAGFFPTDADKAKRTSDALRARSAPIAVKRASAARTGTAVSATGGGGHVTYCVRTCDGFFFPLSNPTGSDKADEAACNRVCPTAETKLYNGQIGVDIDDARSRQTGRRYAAMPQAFAYRSSFNPSCSCNGGRLGLTTAATVAGDRTLKVGDIVMTEKGMRVFIGGQMPYREANFTSIDRAGRFAGQSRDALKRMEQASLPGRSGVAQQRTPRRDELADFRRAAASLETPGRIVRYVGPDRTAIAR